MVNFELAMVVLCLAVVHSFFGVGLLLFGTPSLILMGYGFSEAIAVLLPCSLAIDLLQLRGGLPRAPGFVRSLFLTTLPLVGLGLLAALRGMQPSGVSRLVGAMLIFLALVRCWPEVSRRVHALLVSRKRFYMAAMGQVHGISNMGGGLLVMLASSLSEDKKEVRSLIATGYSLFATTQLVTLLVFTPQAFSIKNLILVPGACMVYLLANKVFHQLSNRQFSHLLTILMLCYGCLVILK